MSADTNGWRPISTAPRGGKFILIRWHNHLAVAYVCIAPWYGGTEKDGYPVTHWQPLPSPDLTPAAPTPPPPEEGATPTEISKEAREAAASIEQNYVFGRQEPKRIEDRAHIIQSAIDTVAAPLRREVEKGRQASNAWALCEADLIRSRESCAELEKERDDARQAATANAIDAVERERERDRLQARTEQLTAEVLALREFVGWFQALTKHPSPRADELLARPAADYAALVPVNREELEEARVAITNVIDELARNSWGPYDVSGILNDATVAQTFLDRAASKGAPQP